MEPRIAYQSETRQEPGLIAGLEPDQLVATSSMPLPRLRLSRAWRIALWALRIFVLLVTGLGVYVFVVNLGDRH